MPVPGSSCRHVHSGNVDAPSIYAPASRYEMRAGNNAMSHNMLSLKVLEAYTRDVGRGIARIDYDSMDSLNASTGDVIEIKGKRRTVAKCLPLYPSDEGKGIIRIDGLGRNNSGIAIGDTAITVKKTKAAEKVVAPLETMPPIDERCLADALESAPLIKGDNVMVPYWQQADVSGHSGNAGIRYHPDNTRDCIPQRRQHGEVSLQLDGDRLCKYGRNRPERDPAWRRASTQEFVGRHPRRPVQAPPAASGLRCGPAAGGGDASRPAHACG